MKRALVFFLSLSISIGFAQDILTVDSKVVSATLYRDRAMVTREGKAHLPKGLCSVKFTQLTSDLENQSVRISVNGTGVIKILDVKVESQATVESPEEKKRLIDNKVDSLKEIYSQVFDKISLLNKEKDLLESFKAQALKDLNEELSVGATQIKEWSDLGTYFDSHLTSILRDLRENTLRQNEIQEQLLILEKQKSQIGGPLKKEYKEILVSIETTVAGPVVLRPSYIVAHSFWYPEYDFRLNSAEKKAGLHFIARLQQSTGEDWHDVSLSVSSAEPHSLGNKPELTPWRIGDMAVPNNGLIRGGRSSGSISVIDDVSQILGENKKTTQGLSTVFNATKSYDVPSDKSMHKIELRVDELPVFYEYTSIPKLQPAVFLKGKCINTDDFPWLPGNISIFIDNDFVNRTQCKATLPTDTLELSLGIDDKISAEKILVNKFHETSGVFTSTAKITYSYEIHLTNNRQTEETVSLYDQLPTILNEDIKVVPIEPLVDSNALPAEKGITWQIKLKPGEKKSLPFKFSIEYPANRNIFGLE